jgi:hypothetical protein
MMNPKSFYFVGILFLLIGLTSILPAQTINVAAGQDGITNALKTAPNGSTIVLTTSGGEYVESLDLTPTTVVTIKAAAGLAAKPTIFTLGTNVILQTKASLTLQGIALSGLYHGNPLGGNGIQIKPDSLGPSAHIFLFVDNCEFTGFADASNGRCIVSSDGAGTVMDSIIIQNSYFHDMLKQGIYLKNTRGTYGIKPGICKYGRVENCLFVRNSASGDGHAMYLEPWDKTVNATYPIYFVNHVTAYRMSTGGIYIYGASEGTIQNSIAYNSCQLSSGGYLIRNEPGRFAGAKNGSVKNSLWFNPPGVATAGLFTVTSNPPTAVDTTKIWNADPQFADTLLAFALKATSPGKNAGTDGKNLGYIAGGLATAVESTTEQAIPETFQLAQNYPNPFNPATTIQFSVAKAGRYSVNVYNVLGQKVAGLFDRAAAPGNYSLRFDATHLPSGMYIYTLTGDGVNISKKMALLK